MNVHDRSAPPIAAHSLSAGYDGQLALDHLTFSIAAGERVAVVGPNGAGKTTLFKVIAGILQPRSGSINVHGHGPGSHICVGYVPQRNQINPDFPVNVAEVVMMGRIRQIGWLRWPKKSDWTEVDRALDAVGMLEHRYRHIGSLSAGQQQRVMLAQAVAQRAELVLLDEPMTGLDVPSQEAIFQILDDLRSRSVTVLLATHDLNLAASHFDRVMLLNRRLVAFGPPETTITPENLLEAYGGQLHVLSSGDGSTVLADVHHEGHQ